MFVLFCDSEFNPIDAPSNILEEYEEILPYIHRILKNNVTTIIPKSIHRLNNGLIVIDRDKNSMYSEYTNPTYILNLLKHYKYKIFKTTEPLRILNIPRMTKNIMLEYHFQLDLLTL